MSGDEHGQRVQQVAGVFDRVADTYDNVGVEWFQPIADELVRTVAPRPGERVLDIGCGRGAALFRLAEAVGPSGRVLGVDVAPRMVEATRDDARRRGLGTVDVEVMDGSALEPGTGPFDLAVASLVLFFLPDPLAALRSWRTAVTAGGRVGLTTFAARDPEWVELDDVFTPFLPPGMLDARTSGSKGPFGSDAGMTALLESAGFLDVVHTPFAVEARFDSPQRWEAFSWSHGQRAMWEAIPEDRRADARQAAFDVLHRLRGADGEVRLRQQVRVTTARTPG